jgi:hypothetical protein
VLPAQQQPVDVPLRQPDQPGIRPARRTGGRSAWVVQLCCRVHHSLPRTNRGPRLPRVPTRARDVTIVPPGTSRGEGHAAAVSASS